MPSRLEPRTTDFLASLSWVAAEWGVLERHLQTAVGIIAELQRARWTFAILVHMPSSAVLNALKTMIKLRLEDENDGLRKQFLALVEYIDRDLRARRNKYIHADWVQWPANQNDDETANVQMVKIHSISARGTFKASFDEVRINDLQATANAIRDAAVAPLALLDEFQNRQSA